MRIYVRKNYKRISQYSFRVSIIRTNAGRLNQSRERKMCHYYIIISSAHLAKLVFRGRVEWDFEGIRTGREGGLACQSDAIRGKLCNNICACVSLCLCVWKIARKLNLSPVVVLHKGGFSLFILLKLNNVKLTLWEQHSAGAWYFAPARSHAQGSLRDSRSDGCEADPS